MSARKHKDLHSIDSVCLLGVNRNTGNLGVEVLLSGSVKLLSSAFPNCKISILDYGNKPERWTESSSSSRAIELINLRFSWKLFLPNNVFTLLLFACLIRLFPFKNLRNKVLALNPWLKAILASKIAFSIAGGDSFSDLYGIRRLIYVSMPQFLVLATEKPLVLLPQTYGPYTSLPSEIIARAILARAVKVFSRDRQGIEIIKELKVHPQATVELLPDVGFAVDPAPIESDLEKFLEERKLEAPLVGLNISTLLFNQNCKDTNPIKLKQDYAHFTHHIIKHLIERLKVNILLVPHVFDTTGQEGNELDLCSKLQAHYSVLHPGRLILIENLRDHKEIRSILKHVELFIGARMHACVAAVSQGVPTLALAYSNKFVGVFEAAGSGVRVSDLRTNTTIESCDLLDEMFASRRELRERLKTKLSCVREGHISRIRLACRTTAPLQEL